MPRQLAVLLALPLATCAAGGCAGPGRPDCPPPPAPCADVAFVANGSGDFRTTTAALCRAAESAGVPLRVETFAWSHGLGRYVTDHVDHDRQVAEGRRLAALVAARRRDCPGAAVYLVGHSAGAAVVLAAAEALPPGSVERVVLLAPSVSCDYDLRPALRAARLGVDAFTSQRDVIQLGLGTGVVGTADRRWAPAAGRVGFRPAVFDPADDALYAKYHEHPWDPAVSWTGYRGGHFGTGWPEFARAYVLPLLRRPDTARGCPARP